MPATVIAKEDTPSKSISLPRETGNEILDLLETDAAEIEASPKNEGNVT